MIIPNRWKNKKYHIHLRDILRLCLQSQFLVTKKTPLHPPDIAIMKTPRFTGKSHMTMNSVWHGVVLSEIPYVYNNIYGC